MSVNRTVARTRSGSRQRSDACHEVLDLATIGVLVAGPDEVVDAGQLDEYLAPVDVLGEIASVLDAEPGRVGPVDDQRGDLDRRAGPREGRSRR